MATETHKTVVKILTKCEKIDSEIHFKNFNLNRELIHKSKTCGFSSFLLVLTTKWILVEA